SAFLVYSLDALSMRAHSVAIVPYLAPGGVEADPELVNWVNHRDSWTSWEETESGLEEHFTACAYAPEFDLDASVECYRRLLSDDDFGVALAALKLANVRLEEFWSEAQPSMSRLEVQIGDLLASEGAQNLLEELHTITGLSESNSEFVVLLIPKPESDHDFAQQSGHFLVHEVDHEVSPERIVSTTFHEAFHFAVERSALTQEFEQAFTHQGTHGILALHWWNECVATAFGNHRTGALLDPDYRVDDQANANPLIDSVGRALAERWDTANITALNAEFATQLVAIFAETWPSDRWRPADFFGRTVGYAMSREPLSAFRDTALVRDMTRNSPIGSSDELRAEEWASHGRLIAMTYEELTLFRDLPTVLPFENEILDVSSPGVFWIIEESGRASALVVGADASELVEICRWFARLDSIPATEWTPMGDLDPSE
ncbi:MAG: hypothetical protein KC561_02460, partial [Myxococcales bacterium]|nr:hypothetical protein [Myxococcales bacterium]